MGENDALQQEAAPEQEGQAGYQICIAVMPDGTFATYQEPLEQQEEPGVSGGEVVDSFGAALKAALQIYKENPIGESEQEQFNAGFGGSKPEPMQKKYPARPLI